MEKILKSNRSPDKEASPTATFSSKSSPVTSASPPSKTTLTYSIEYLAQLAMSPLCLTEPTEWDRIVLEYPMLTRQVSWKDIHLLLIIIMILKQRTTENLK